MRASDAPATHLVALWVRHKKLLLTLARYALTLQTQRTEALRAVADRGYPAK